MDIPRLRSPFFIRYITPTVTITASLRSSQNHNIVTPFMIMPGMDLLLVSGKIHTPIALAGLQIVVIPTRFPQGFPLVTLAYVLHW